MISCAITGGRRKMKDNIITEVFEEIKANELGFLPSKEAKDNFMNSMLYVMLNS